ncbi:MAG: hypothetical protein WEB58_04655 [Planctomycetaceae bacterium]
MNSPTITRLSATSLQRSVEQTVRDGRLGTIVSLRVLMSAGDRPIEQLAGWLTWSETVFGCETGKVFASTDRGGRQLSVLVSLSSGATLSLTAITYPPASDTPAHTLQLLLIGQHGIARLQGGDDIDPTLSPTIDSSSKWMKAIEQSVRSQTAVEVV